MLEHLKHRVYMLDPNENEDNGTGCGSPYLPPLAFRAGCGNLSLQRRSPIPKGEHQSISH